MVNGIVHRYYDVFDFIRSKKSTNDNKEKRLIVLKSESNGQVIISVTNNYKRRIYQINKLEEDGYIPIFEANCRNPYLVRRNLYRRLKDSKCTGNREHKYDIKYKDLVEILSNEMNNMESKFAYGRKDILQKFTNR